MPPIATAPAEELEMLPPSSPLHELTLNLHYSIKGVVEAFRKLRRRPNDATVQERWLVAIAKCQTASDEYLGAIRSQSAL